MRAWVRIFNLILMAGILPGQAPAADQGANVRPAVPMTADRIELILEAVCDDVLRNGRIFEGALQGRRFQLITDPAADRMRILTPIVRTSELDEAVLERLLKANFDTALDARYAIARGYLWSTYIHPLSPTTDAQLISGLAQTVTAAATFGSSYSSGALSFGGGDSGPLLQELQRRLRSL